MSSSKIKYVVLSDLHFGERIGVLNKIDTDNFNLKDFDISSAAKSLVKLIHYLTEQQPNDDGFILVLNGDLLGMSFGKMHEILTIFAAFLKCVFDEIGPSKISEIVYLPGNHDHHIWEMARESDYCKKASALHAGQPFPEIKHTTGPYLSNGIESELLNSIFDHLFGPEKPKNLPPLKLVYPNLICQDDENRKAVVIHHGHFLEELYHFVSLTRKVLHPEIELPNRVEDIERENFAWIDFIWSTLGRSGAAGYDVEMIMKIMGNPDSSEQEVDMLSTRISKALDFPYIPFDAVEKVLIKTLIQRISKKAKYERLDDSEICSESTMHQLIKYLSGACAHQLGKSMRELPKHLAFIWGHTHKPFEKMIHTEFDQELHVYNTGGWTVDSLDVDGIRGGTMVLIDSELNITNLRIFDTSDDDGEIKLNVKSLDTSTDLFKSLKKSIDEIPLQILRELNETFATETILRREYYRNEALFNHQKSET